MILIQSALAKPVVVHPPVDSSSFANPYRGWVSWWENQEEPLQPGTMVFAYQRWKDTEPVQGRYEFDAWDAKNLQYWTDRGFHVILRLELDYPRKEAEADVPQLWSRPAALVARRANLQRLRAWSQEGGVPEVWGG